MSRSRPQVAVPAEPPEAAQPQPAKRSQPLQAGRPGPAPDARDVRWPAWLPWVLAWAGFAPVAVLRAGLLTDSDTFWQIRTGLLIIGTRAIPAADTFSWTVHGRPWTQNSWGFDVLAGLAYRLAGLPGTAWTCAALIMAVAGAALLLARLLGAAPAAAGGALLLASPLLISWLQARPELVDYAAVPLLVIVLGKAAGNRAAPGRATPARRAGWAAAAGLLSCAWVNLHAAALLGVAIAAAATAMLAAWPAARPAARWRTAGWAAAAAAATAGGALASPLGAGLVVQTARVESASAGLIAEWQRFDPASPAQWAALAAGAAALILAARRRDAVLTAALAVTLAGGIVAVRIQPVLVLLAVPVLATAASRPAVAAYARSRRAVLYPGAAVGLLTLFAVAAPSLTHIGEPDPAVYPARVVAAIPPGCRLFNSYLIGGYVILERPDVPVSLDSRNDLYGAARIMADERVLRGQGDLASELSGAGCVLVPPASGLARRLATDPAWTRRSGDRAAVLYLRR